MTNESQDRDVPSVGGFKNEVELTMHEVESRVPYYALRALNGASVMEDVGSDQVHVRSCGNDYVVSKKTWTIVERVVERVRREECALRGMMAPYNVEDQIRMIHAATKFTKQECMLDPKKLRVYFMRQDQGGCGWYRVMQPVRAINQYCSDTIIAEESDWLTFPLGQKYDVIVAPRVSHPLTIGILRNLQSCGKIIVYEADDLLSAVPDYNPYKEMHDEVQAFREFFVKMADAAIVSTPELGAGLGRDNIHVCHNGIDPALWPMTVRGQADGKVRILWAGSATHEADLRMIVPAIRKVITKFGDNVEFVWVNYIPPEFIGAATDTNGNLQRVVLNQFKGNMRFVPGCHVAKWPELLKQLDCHMALAPLVDNAFNRAKSEIKVLESWALGIPIVASDIAPYARAIEHNVNGVLCAPNPDVWFNEIKRLVESPKRREALATDGLAQLRARYTTELIAKQYESALLNIAAGKVPRKECRDAIAGRLWRTAACL